MATDKPTKPEEPAQPSAPEQTTRDSAGGLSPGRTAAEATGRGTKRLGVNGRNLAGGIAGTAARTAIEGDSSSTARRAAGRYGGAAVSGAISGAQAGGPHGAVAGAAKEVGVEAARDAVRGVSTVTGGGPDAKPADERLGAGGTGFERTGRQPDEGIGKKAGKIAAIGGGAAATPGALAVVMLMALLNWLKSMFFAFMAMAMNAWALALQFLLNVVKTVASTVAAPFLAIGGFLANTVGAVLGVTVAATVAPAMAALSGVIVAMTVASLVGTMVTGLLNNTAFTDGAISSEDRCTVNTFSAGWRGGPVDPNEEAHAKAVYSVLSGMGMPDENIAGILGNWSQESGIDPTSVQGIFSEPYQIGPSKRAKLAGDGRNYGIGFGQWTAVRNTLLRDYAQEKGKPWHDFELQLQFMADPQGDNPGDVAIFQGMIQRSLGSPGAAAQHFEEKWERAGKPNMANRIARADAWYAKIRSGDWKSGGSSNPATNVSNSSRNPNSNSGRPSLQLGPVKPHVQEAAEIIYNKFPGITSAGGYRSNGSRDPNGHPAGLAVDFMVPMTPAGKATGDAVSEFAIQNAQALNVKYVIWQQRIWNISSGATSWRQMEDRGSPTQNHMDHPHISFEASGSVTNVVDPLPFNLSACPEPGSAMNAGTGTGGVTLHDGGMSQEQAQKLVDLYNTEGDKYLDDRYGARGGPGSCGDNHAMNCVSFSTYFVNKYTSFQKYPQGDGIQTAHTIASMSGKQVSSTPTPYSVGSGPGSGPAGHTFVVLGVQGDKVIVGEAGYCAFMGRVSVKSASQLAAAGWKFVDVSDLVTDRTLV